MRTEDEIQRAHDLFHFIVCTPDVFSGDEKQLLALISNLDVLCWVLRHDHNRTFSENLAHMRHQLALRNIKEVRAPAPFTGPYPGPMEKKQRAAAENGESEAGHETA